MLRSIFVVTLAVIAIVHCVDERPIVKTENGLVRGVYRNSRKGRQFAAFEGVPYAQPPVGDLRFKEPQPKEPWTGMWDAMNVYECIQVPHEPRNQGNVEGTEDCLYVNVYTPAIVNDKPLDVIVHIHGGAFMFGHGDQYGPNNLMDRNIVYVNLNYRLGPLGLFHRAFSMSGTALSNWALVENPLQKARQLGVIVGCGQVATQDLVQCLRQRSATQIQQAITHFQPWLYNPYSPFGPTVELAGDNKFLPDLPYNLLQQGHVADVPWITSVTSDEGLYPAADFVFEEKRLPYLDQHWTELAPYILHYDGTVPRAQQADVAQKIKEYYLKGEPISRETFPALVQAIGDRLFVVEAEKAARLQAQVNKSPVYFYRFSYRGGHSISEYYAKNQDNFGVSHADDWMYVASPDPTWFAKYLQTDEDKKMTESLLDMLTSFAKSGKPKMSGIKWKPVSEKANDKIKYLHIASPDDMKMEKAEHLGHRPFWDSLPFKENNNIVPVKDEL
ncbi:Esterase 6 [Carabus blaptoides fortunei]